jgi:anti-anti-sigma regulatory factor
MLRITELCDTSEQALLMVEGWVSGGNVTLLEEECTRRHRAGRRVVLDLTGVRAIDRGGIELLRRWRNARLTLRGGSSFILTLLASHGLDEMVQERNGGGS